MAEKLVKTGYGNGQSNFPIKLYVTYETKQSNGADNYSEITCGMKVTTPGSGWDIGTWTDHNGSYVGTDKLTFNGTIPNFAGTYTIVTGKKFKVQHNDDGTGKATIYWKWGVNSSWGGFVNPSGSFEIDLPKINRYFSSTPTLKFKDKTETQIRYDWSTSEECSAISISGSGTKSITGLPGKSGIVTITGLSANTEYAHTGTFTRKDSGLTSNSSQQKNTTYNYPHITTAPDFTIGNTYSIGLYNPLGRSCDVRIQSWGGTEMAAGTTTGTTLGPGFNSSTQIDNYYKSIPSAKSGTYKVRLICSALSRDTSVSGGTYSIIGNEVPTFADSNITNVVDTLHVNDITGLNTKIIKGHNKITGTIVPMSPQKRSNGKRYIVNANANPTSQEITYATSNKTFTFENITSNSFSVVAYDTRELSTSRTKTIDLVDYSKPKINNFTITRQNGLGVYAILSADGTFTHWTGWSQIKKYNTIQKVYLRYKASTTSTWGSWTDITKGLTKNTGGQWTLALTLDTSFTTTVKYDFQIYVTDLLESSTPYGNSLSTANGFLWRDLKNKRLGINKKPTCALDVNGDVNVDGVITSHNKVQVDNDVVATNVQATKVLANDVLVNDYSLIPIDITGQTTTILSLVQGLASKEIRRATWFTKTDGGATNISDRPVTGTNGFSCTAEINRYNNANDWRYILTAHVRNVLDVYMAIVEAGTTAITWTKMFDTRAPKAHSSTGTGYGVGTSSNYGHCKVIDNLTSTAFANGNALSAYQGKVLKDSIDGAKKKLPTGYYVSGDTQKTTAVAKATFTSTYESAWLIGVAISCASGSNEDTGLVIFKMRSAASTDDIDYGVEKTNTAQASITTSGSTATCNITQSIKWRYLTFIVLAKSDNVEILLQ